MMVLISVCVFDGVDKESGVDQNIGLGMLEQCHMEIVIWFPHVLILFDDL